MTKKKLKLAYIENDSMRKSTFTKRKRGFLKKINELSVLCGIEACAVINSPFTSIPEMWPSHSGVKSVVEKFQMLPEMETAKKMVNHEGFLQQSVTKAVENNKKKEKENMERTMKEVMFMYLGGKGNNLTLSVRSREDLCNYVDLYLKELHHHKKEILTQPVIEYGESSSSKANVMTPPPPTVTITEVGSEANVMAPPPPMVTITEVGSSSSSFGHTNVVPHLGNELWSSIQKQEQVETFGSGFIHAPSDQQGYYPTMNPVSDCNYQNQNLYFDQNQYQYHQHQEFMFPNVAQDGMYNPNRQEEWFVDNMIMNHADQQIMSFPTMDGNNGYHHQRP